MPSINIDGLTKPLEDAQDHISKAINILDKHARDLRQYSGKVGEVVPLNIQSINEMLVQALGDPDSVDVASTQGGASIASLIAYLDSVPVKDLKSPAPISMGSPKLNPKAMSGNNDTITDDGIDVTPDVSAGPKSAVQASLKDSVLDKYLKAARISEGKKLAEKKHKLSLEVTLDDMEIGNDLEVSYDDQDYSSEYAFDDEYDDEAEYDEGLGSDGPLDWQGATTPEDEDTGAFSFKDIMDDPDLADDGDFGELGALSAKNAPVDPMRNVKREPVAGPIDNSDGFSSDYDDDDLGIDFDDSDDFQEEPFEEEPAPAPVAKPRQPAEAPRYTAAQKELLKKGIPVIPMASKDMNTDWKSLIKKDADVSLANIVGK